MTSSTRMRTYKHFFLHPYIPILKLYLGSKVSGSERLWPPESGGSPEAPSLFFILQHQSNCHDVMIQSNFNNKQERGKIAAPCAILKLRCAGPFTPWNRKLKFSAVMNSWWCHRWSYFSVFGINMCHSDVPRWEEFKYTHSGRPLIYTGVIKNAFVSWAETLYIQYFCLSNVSHQNKDFFEL